MRRETIIDEEASEQAKQTWNDSFRNPDSNPPWGGQGNLGRAERLNKAGARAFHWLGWLAGFVGKRAKRGKKGGTVHPICGQPLSQWDTGATPVATRRGIQIPG